MRFSRQRFSTRSPRKAVRPSTPKRAAPDSHPVFTSAASLSAISKGWTLSEGSPGALLILSRNGRSWALDLVENTPDHSTISRTRRLIDVETHRGVFVWVLDVLSRE